MGRSTVVQLVRFTAARRMDRSSSRPGPTSTRSEGQRGKEAEGGRGLLTAWTEPPLPEQLRGALVGRLRPGEPVQPDAQEAHGASGRLGLLEERRGAGRDLGGVARRRVARVAARDRPEVGVAQLQRDRAGGELASRQERRGVARERLDLARASARGPSGLSRRSPRSRRTCAPGWARRGGRRRRGRGGAARRPSCRRAAEDLVRRGAHVDQPRDAGRAQSRRGLGPDAPQRVDRKVLQERLHPLGRDRRSGRPASSSPRRSWPGTCSARRRRTPSAASPRGSRPSGGCATVDAERLAPGVLGDVEVRLVERERLDERRDRRGRWPRSAATRLRYFVKSGRTITSSGHRRTARDIGMAERTPKRARLVARGADDAPALGRAAHGDRAAARARVVALLDGRVERVHVDVQDLADGHRSRSLPVW